MYVTKEENHLNLNKMETVYKNHIPFPESYKQHCKDAVTNSALWCATLAEYTFSLVMCANLISQPKKLIIDISRWKPVPMLWKYHCASLVFSFSYLPFMWIIYRKCFWVNRVHMLVLFAAHCVNWLKEFCHFPEQRCVTPDQPGKPSHVCA